MNPERITQPIETEDTAEHEREINKRLTALEVHFADSRYRKEGDFSDALYKYTPIMKRLRNRYRDIHEEEEASEKLAFATSIENEINRIYRETPSQEEREEQITRYVFDIYSHLKKKEPDEIESAMEKDTTIGAVKIEPGIREELRMEKVGFDPEEEFVSIHFPPLYESGPGKSLLTEVNKSFAKLAEMIPQKYPEARGIIGESWLLSLPAAERLGFKKVMTLENQFNGNGLWSQFIDQNGNISKSRFDEFMRTGKPPYEVTLGYIPIEEFLSKYLPPEKKGEITLKEITPGWRENSRELRTYIKEVKQFRNNFSRFIENKNLSAEALIKRYPAIVSVTTKAGCYSDFLNLIAAAKEKGYNIEEISKRMPDESARIEKANETYRSALENKKYQDRKVLIR